MRVIGSERIHIKQRCGNNQSVLQDVVEALRDWGHALSLWERELRATDSDNVVYRHRVETLETALMLQSGRFPFFCKLLF